MKQQNQDINFSKGSLPLENPKVLNFVEKSLKEFSFLKFNEYNYCDFSNATKHWLTSSLYNSIRGLDEFVFDCYSSGTSPAFTSFIGRHINKRIRYSRNDFALSKIVSNAFSANHCYLEDDKLKEGDALILSMPFSGNGGLIDNYNNILTVCDSKDIPVMIDGAYFGISFGVDYNLTHKCITDFCTSLSKPYGFGQIRVGIRFTKEEIDDELTALTVFDNYNKLGAWLGHRVIENFNHNWVIDQHRQIYLDICEEYNLNPTNTLTLGLGGTEYANKFKRNDYVRVCVSGEINQRLATR